MTPRALLAGLVLCGAVAAGAVASAPKPLPAVEGVMTVEPRVAGDLAMTDQDGAATKLSELAGAPVLVFFGFTHCPEVCPATLQKLAIIKRTHPKQLAGLRIVLLSVDGERDTPEVLKAFLARFSEDFVGLTAPAAEMRTLALKFSAPFFKDPPRDGAYLVQHSARVYALDKQGRLRAEIYAVNADAVLGIGRALLAE